MTSRNTGVFCALKGGAAASALIASATAAFAGGLDRSGQNTSIIFQDGRYLELAASFTSPSVDGEGELSLPGPFPPAGAYPTTTGSAQDSYWNIRGGYKADINEKLSYAVIIDQPYGANANFEGGSLDLSSLGAGSTSSPLNGTFGTFNSEALTGLLRYKIGGGFSVHGGVTVLRASAKSANTLLAYEVSGETDPGFGVVVGGAYEIPEIALRIAATYHSAIDADVTYDETITTAAGTSSQSTDDTLSFPQAVNISVQSGVNEKTLVFANFRWADYENFDITPPTYETATGGSLVSYGDPGIDASVGVARRITEKLALIGTLSWQPETGTDDPSLLSPTDGRIGYALAARYSTEFYDLTVGGQYTDLGDESFAAPTAFDFKDNSAFTLGASIGLKL
ncbi:MAG: hypothetical protein AAFR57_03080 [Pseudomonadota bacterium]